jgi:hypothetical protein
MEMKMTNQYPQTIEQAALLLDEVKPNWYEKIDLDKLDMHLGTSCILGQSYNGYGSGIKEIFGKDFYNTRMDEELKDDLVFGRSASREKWIEQISLRKNTKYKEATPVNAPQINNDRASIQITIPKGLVKDMVHQYIFHELDMQQVKLEDIEPIMQQEYDNPPEFEGFKATIFVG